MNFDFSFGLGRVNHSLQSIQSDLFFPSGGTGYLTKARKTILIEAICQNYEVLVKGKRKSELAPLKNKTFKKHEGLHLN